MAQNMSARGKEHVNTDNLSKKCRTFVLSRRNVSAFVTKSCKATDVVPAGSVFAI